MTLLAKNWKPNNIYMEIFITFPSLSAMENLGNGLFIFLRVDFAFVNKKKEIWKFCQNSTNILWKEYNKFMF